MRRIHAIELEDQPWMPRLIRDFATDYLRHVIEMSDAYAPVLPLITEALHASGEHRVVDLCSGGGGPWPGLLPRVRAKLSTLQVVLTDRYPNAAAAERVKAIEGLSYHDEPVDALRVPAQLTGFRTMFTALHHFRPDEVR